jgi:hypothetical protein
MTGIGADTENQLAMVIEAYITLQEQNPNPEEGSRVAHLLSVATPHDDRYGMDFSKEYREEFVLETDKYRIQGYIRYWQAMLPHIRGGKEAINQFLPIVTD